MMFGNNLDTAVTGVCVGLAKTKQLATCEFTYNDGAVAKDAPNGEPLYLGFVSFAEMDTFIETLQRMSIDLKRNLTHPVEGGDKHE